MIDNNKVTKLTYKLNELSQEAEFLKQCVTGDDKIPRWLRIEGCDDFIYLDKGTMTRVLEIVHHATVEELSNTKYELIDALSKQSDDVLKEDINYDLFARKSVEDDESVNDESVNDTISKGETK